MGFLVEEVEGSCTVFIPEMPKMDSGDAKIVPSSQVKRVNVPNNLAALSYRNYGKGAISWINKS
jgi:hypothetical protein